MRQQLFNIDTGELVEIEIYPMDRIERDYFLSQRKEGGENE